MAGGIKARGSSGNTSSHENPSAGAPQTDAVRADGDNGNVITQLLAQYTARGNQANELEAEIKDNPNAIDMDVKRGQLSSLHLEAAGILHKIIALARSDAKKRAELIERYGENVIEDLEKAEEERMSAAIKKYGSRVKKEIPKTTLDDIIGQEDVKKIVKSFVFMAQKKNELFDVYKIKGGLGMMLYGAPGTGKTMFAEAIANAMQLPLFVITPADIFKSYVGASEQAVRQIFQDIASFPDGAILFVDECESIFSKRDGDTKDYKSAVTSEILQRMNGEGVDGSRRIMIAATNRPWDIDPAYLRYKRFSHLIHVAPPPDEAIEAIVKNKLKGIPQEEGVAEYAADVLTRNDTGRYSAADVCGIVEEACRMAIEAYEEACEENAAAEYVKISKKMMDMAIDKRKPSIPYQDLQVYENFKPGSMLN